MNDVNTIEPDMEYLSGFSQKNRERALELFEKHKHLSYAEAYIEISKRLDIPKDKVTEEKMIEYIVFCMIERARIGEKEAYMAEVFGSEIETFFDILKDTDKVENGEKRNVSE